ncbi:MAG: glycosyltransferase family 2 protein [Candidatus Zhuqueibacterota bacterium]
MNHAKINIIVCTYNRANMLRNALTSLSNQVTDRLFQYDILVVDDNSTDDTPAVVRRFIPTSKAPVTYIHGSGEGIARARNRGIDASDGDYVVFFDDDQIAEPDWLKEMFITMQETGACCVGGIRLLNLSRGEVSRLSPITRRILGEIHHGDAARKSRRKEFPAAGNMLIRRSVFNIVGNFDDSLVKGGEDIEFARQVRLAGLDAWYTPKSIVYHETPLYRTKSDYLYWTSLRNGDNFAYRDYLEWGLPRTVLANALRWGQVAFINLPLFLWAWFQNNEKEQIGRKCLLLRARAYSYQTLHLLSPKLFRFKKFFEQLEFRKERETFATNAIPENA